MLMRIDPFRGVDRLFDRSWSFGPVLPLDARRVGDHLEISVDVPGVDPDAIEVTLEKDVLTISAERPATTEDKGDAFVSERPSGRFTRRVFLGRQLDGEHVTATHDNGVLVLSVPLLDPSARRRIEVGRAVPTAIEQTTSEEVAA